MDTSEQTAAARPLRVLFIDDSEDDVLLVKRELRRVGFELTSEHVWSGDAVRAALAREWDFVISDWSMPNFTGLDAFRLVREVYPDLPFIIISGTIGEDIAVDALKAGVQDFLVKGKYARLAPTIQRELGEAAVRRRDREAEALLAEKHRAVERSERLLLEVVDAVPEGVVVIDARKQILIWNAAASALFGPNPGDLDRFTAQLTQLEADGATRRQAEIGLAKALRGESIDRYEKLVAVSSLGKTVWLSVSTRPLRDSHGIHGALAVYRDLTEERASQQQLMISDRMASIGMLAAGVAHELNNPLAAVMANLEMVAEAAESPGGFAACDEVEMKAMLSDARDASERVRQIVKDLRIFSRHEDTMMTAVDVRRTLESTLRMAWNEIRHRARLVKDYGQTPLVQGSESRLGQVFLNLIMNAAQAIEEGHADRNTLRIVTGTQDDGQVFVEISDTGVGMSSETQRKLFTPFFTTKPQGEGTGLGLTISHRIVTSLGGNIRVTSALGQGTTFRICLPVAAEPSKPRTRSQSREPELRRARILAIDDEPMITKALHRMFSQAHDVEVVGDGKAALELIRKGARFDVILCDVMMPVMTGMELYEELGVEHADQAARMIFMTGDAFTAAARAFLDTVPNPRIDKPFDAQQLRAVLRDRLGIQ